MKWKTIIIITIHRSHAIHKFSPLCFQINLKNVCAMRMCISDSTNIKIWSLALSFCIPFGVPAYIYVWFNEEKNRLFFRFSQKSWMYAFGYCMYLWFNGIVSQQQQHQQENTDLFFCYYCCRWSFLYIYWWKSF